MRIRSTAGPLGALRNTPRGLSRSAMRKYALPMISLAVILIVVVAVSLADVIAPYGPLEQDLGRSLEPPSSAHWLGTDAVGRDILSRMLFGGRPALLGVALALLVFLVVGTILGVLAGYLGGWADRVIGLVVDLFMALPNVILILAVLAVFSQSQIAAMVTFGILASANLIRIVRAAVISFRDELYVSAAVVSGLSDARIMSRHILPGVIGPVLVQASLLSGIALSVQTGLGFLGIADRPPMPSWGGMIGEAAQVLSSSGYFLLFTGGIVAIMTFAFGFLGDGLRDLSADTKKQAAAGLFRRQARGRRDAVGPVPPADRELLAVRDYSVAFKTGDALVETVHRLNWGLKSGEIVGLVGESGSGKSVTALSLLGLLPANGVVTSGGAWLNGELITGLSEKKYQSIRGSGIALVSQEPMVSLDPSFTIGSQLQEVVRVHRPGGREGAARERALELLRLVRLRDPEAVMNKYPHELSGGMIQRVVIAMALSGDPELLIADEPTTALDVTVQAEILDLLRDLRERTGMAILIVTHDLGVVADICDRVLIMSRGEIVERGDLEEIFYAPQEEYTKQLLRSTPSLVERN